MGSRSGAVPGPRRTSRRSLASDGGEADGEADRVDAAFALAGPKKDQEREKASEKRRRLEGENPGGVTAVLDVQKAEELAAASTDSEMIMGNALAQSSPVCMSTPPGGGSSPGSEAGAKGSPGAKMSLSIKVPGTAEKHDGLEPSRTPHRHRSSSLWHSETPKFHNAIYNAAGGGGEPNVAELTRLLEDSSTRAFIDWPDPTEGWTGLLRKSRACDTGRAPVGTIVRRNCGSLMCLCLRPGIMAAATVRDGALSASLCGLLLQHKASLDLGDKAGLSLASTVAVCRLCPCVPACAAVASCNCQARRSCVSSSGCPDCSNEDHECSNAIIQCVRYDGAALGCRHRQPRDRQGEQNS